MVLVSGVAHRKRGNGSHPDLERVIPENTEGDVAPPILKVELRLYPTSLACRRRVG